tara:strand:- start:1203 stop:1784 length:582 start_codon:yes stop_codon:yes gene_type:complete
MQTHHTPTVSKNLKMKNLIVLIFICISISAYSQKPYFGVDLGYHFGKYQYFESGLNLTMKNDSSTFGGALSIGLLDNTQSNNFGYKVGLVGYNLKRGSFPILFGLNTVRHDYNEKTFFTYGAEIGLVQQWHHLGRGLSFASISYGYNFTDPKFKSFTNEHYFKLSVNTNLKGFIEFLGFMGYKVVSIFHPNWS